MKYLFRLFFFLPLITQAQNSTFDQELFDDFEIYREQSLTKLRFKHNDIQPLIEQISKKQGFEVRKVGESIEGRSISLISVGRGDIDILLWSQMHGNEPTATMAIFDILNFLADNEAYADEKTELLDNVRIHFIPMLNPDGAEHFKRRNALNIDINRDALRLQSPEGQILKKVRDSLDAEFGFNLHDQSRYYNVERTDKPATISYLAPAYNYDKEINEVRGNAMKVIVHMNKIIQKYAPGQVGGYNDDFEPRAFGDNIQKWGTSAILIESGGQYNDPEKQFIRKLNYMSILSAIFVIADGSYRDLSIDDYKKIPRNDRKLFDLKIKNLTYNIAGKNYVLDVGIIRDRVDDAKHENYHYVGRIAEIGDLSTYFGYQTIDASGLEYEMGKLKTGTENVLTDVDILELLKEGYTDIQLSTIPKGQNFSNYPINITLSDTPSKKDLSLGRNATFLLMSGDQLRYVVVNGFLFDTSANSGELNIVNGIVR